MVKIVNIGKNINLSKSALLKAYDVLSPIFFLINTAIKNKNIFDTTVIILAPIKCDSFISAILLNSDTFTQSVR